MELKFFKEDLNIEINRYKNHSMNPKFLSSCAGFLTLWSFASADAETIV